MNLFNNHFIGARTSANKTETLEKQFSISVSKENNVINHTADVVLLNPAAQIQAYFIYPHQPKTMAKDYQTIIEKQK